MNREKIPHAWSWKWDKIEILVEIVEFGIQNYYYLHWIKISWLYKKKCLYFIPGNNVSRQTFFSILLLLVW